MLRIICPTGCLTKISTPLRSRFGFQGCSGTRLYGTRDHALTSRRTYILSLDEQKNKYRALDDWFKTPQGRYVGEAWAECLMSASDRLHGASLLQLGVCGENPWLAPLSYRRQWLLTPCVGTLNASLVVSLTRLPLDRNSIDCIIAPLTMEAFGRDKNPLDEIDRVLKPMGHVVFFGINPLSMWGLALRLGYLSCFGDCSGMLMSPLMLKQSLFERGYCQCLFDTFYYIPPLKHSSMIEGLAFLNEMGKMVAPSPSGFYCLIVQKMQYCQPSRLVQVKAPLLVHGV